MTGIQEGTNMFNKLSQRDIAILVEGELGINSLKFINIVENIGTNKKLVDIGVETGKSSRILLNNAIDRNNIVYGIDPIPAMGQEILDNPNYRYLNADSVATGRDWKNGNVDVIFVDSIHAKEQVLGELYYWWDLLNENGWVIFHDTAWEGYIHKPTHPCAGRKTGNSGLGYDYYGGVAWETPDKAVKLFFGLSELRDYEDEYIKLEHGPKDLGMTFIYKKKHKDYKSLISNWNLIFDKRDYLLKHC